jgi:hypothetical protein
VRAGQAQREIDRVRDQVAGLDEQERAHDDGEHGGSGGTESRRGGAAVACEEHDGHDEHGRPGGGLEGGGRAEGEASQHWGGRESGPCRSGLAADVGPEWAAAGGGLGG